MQEEEKSLPRRVLEVQGRLRQKSHYSRDKRWGFPSGTGVKSLPSNAGDATSTPGLEKSHMLQGK